jgi:hypothetical protein
MNLGLNSYTPIRYHKKWMQDRIKYPVLTISQLSDKALESVRAFVKPLVTGEEAGKKVVQLIRAAEGESIEWSYSLLDQLGNVGVLRYRGIEVALYFKRQVTEQSPGIGEPIPEARIEDPTDVWQRLDLLGPSAKKANVVLKNYHEGLQSQIALLTQEVNIWKQKAETAESRAGKKITEIAYKTDKTVKLLEAKINQLAARVPRSSVKRKLDRPCKACGCYENVHEFKSAKAEHSTTCTGGKKKCKGCRFQPTKQRLRKGK